MDAPHSSRATSIRVSRAITIAVVLSTIASYLWQPETGWHWALDIVARTYLHFVAGVMAHEAVHGCLGRSRAANLWWGRLALLPTTVPFVTFRLTHLAHHRHTNVHGLDPDAYLDAPSRWRLPLRAVAMPHQWVLWLKRSGRLRRAEWIEYLATYAAYLAVYAAVAAHAGTARVLLGLIPAAVLHSLLLWIPFAAKTHEGYSTGRPEERSHDYRGRLAFWLSFGLSAHRVHHLRPSLGWLQLAAHVPAATWAEALTFRRDIRLPASPGGR